MFSVTFWSCGESGIRGLKRGCCSRWQAQRGRKPGSRHVSLMSGKWASMYRTRSAVFVEACISQVVPEDTPGPGCGYICTLALRCENWSCAGMTTNVDCAMLALCALDAGHAPQFELLCSVVFADDQFRTVAVRWTMSNSSLYERLPGIVWLLYKHHR